MSVSLISTSTPAYANTSNQTTQRSVSNSVTSIASQQATKTAVSTDNAPPSSSADVVVMLSTQAMNASKTALTVTAEQKSFGQVALDARASMDSQYAAMKASGNRRNKITHSQLRSSAFRHCRTKP